MIGLKKLFPNISSLLLAPDANQHKPFIDALMNTVRGYLSQQAQASVGGGGGQGAPGGAAPSSPQGSLPPGAQSPLGPMGGPPGPGQPPPMSNAPGGGGGMTGLMGAASQNPDELRRLLTATANP